ncbi:hypothetical protein PG990_000091 [Apiospora arundinis]
MGADAGFDMVPRLGLGAEDAQKWALFITKIKDAYADDAQVEFGQHQIEFKAGEHPTLPLHGQHFLRFGSKVTGRIASETGVHAYIGVVRGLATQVFGTRIRRWSELNDTFGFYDWRDVYESARNAEAGKTKASASRFADNKDESDDYPFNSDNILYQTIEIPGKGKGLVARYNIKRGTRVLSEKPLVVAGGMEPQATHVLIASKLRTFSREQQTQFLSLYNNFPGRHAFAGIFRTNALPCGPGAAVGGVYPDICRINHSCRPNCHNSWNEAPGQEPHETIHAIRDILAGEELTISYDKGGPSDSRQAALHASFGFDCKCELCSLPADERQASDARRRRIQALDEQIGDPMTMMAQPLASLHACRALLDTLREEFPDPNRSGEAMATALIPRLYYDAVQIVGAHGDQARARVFAERGYQARVECEGEDSPATQRAKRLMQEPSSHAAFGACETRWGTSKTAQPNKEAVGDKAFEKWLWRL